MNVNTLHDVWTLGGHVPYVWGSLALCAVAVLTEWQSLRQARKRALLRVRRMQRNKGKTAQ